MPLRVVFMGTPAFAAPTLTRIAAAGHEVVAVYTQPPRPAGRGLDERRSPVHDRAAGMGLPVFSPRSLREASVRETFAQHRGDVAVVVAYGLILPKPILDAPRQGCLNIHASLLPRWRGAAPIQRAIMAGDRQTGICIMRMEEGLDTGPVCLARPIPIGAEETAGELHDCLAELGADLVVEALAALERGVLTCAPQADVGVTYAAKIDKAETRIDWRLPADQLARQVRGLSPAPGAWCEGSLGGTPERIRVTRAVVAERSGDPGTILSLEPFLVACGEEALKLTELQRAGRKPVPAEAFLRGARLAPGARLA